MNLIPFIKVRLYTFHKIENKPKNKIQNFKTPRI